jgi:hypothetical protein
LAQFDVDPGNVRPPGVPNGYVGTFPEGHVDSYQDGYSVDTTRLKFDSEPTWSHPDTTRETKSRRTVDGNPGGQ